MPATFSMIPGVSKEAISFLEDEEVSIDPRASHAAQIRCLRAQISQ